MANIFGNPFTEPFDNDPFDNDVEFNPDKRVVNEIAKDIQRFREEGRQLDIPSKRSILDRGFDTLLTPLYTTAGVARGFVNDEFTPAQGFITGLRAGNPFGEGYEKGEHTYSRFLEDLGWKPESTAGKIAKGTTGFVLDVLLDPTTYMTFGTSALAKGTGRVGAELTHAVPELTEEVAERIIRDKVEKNSLSFSDDVIKDDARKLVEEYNKLTGIRDTAKGISIGVRNLPFGDKLTSRTPKTLISGETLQKIGDKTFSKSYTKLRDGIYGTKLGKLFSTKSRLYELSKTSPEAVYDFLKFSDIIKGRNLDKVKEEERITQLGRQLLNLSPAESKQVIELMQDKTIWHPVKKTIRLLDSEWGKRLYKEKKSEISKLQKEIDTLTREKEELDKVKSVFGEEKKELVDEYENVLNEYIQQLEKAKGKDFADLEKYEARIGVLQDEIDEIARKLNDEDVLINEHILNLWSRYKQNKTPNNKYELIDTLSKRYGGKEGFISKTTSDSDIEDIIKDIQNNTPKNYIEDYIMKNMQKFNSQLSTKYNYIAQEVGYGKGTYWDDWKQVMDEYRKIRDKERSGKLLTAGESTEKVAIEKMIIKRKKLIDQFKKFSDEGYSDDEIVNLIKNSRTNKKISSRKEGGELQRSKYLDDAEARRGGFVDEDTSVEKRKDWRKNPERLDDPRDRFRLSPQEEDELSDLIIKKRINDKSLDELNNGDIRYLGKMMDKAKELLAFGYKKRFYQLDHKQKEKLVNWAGWEIDKADELKDISIADIMRKKAKEEFRRRYEVNRQRYLLENIRTGSDVKFKHRNVEVYGKVKNIRINNETNQVVYDLVTEDGLKLMGVRPNKIVDVDNTKLNTPEDIMKNSPIVKEYMEKQKRLVDEVDELQDKIKHLNKNQKRRIKYTKQKSATIERLKNLDNTIRTLEEKHLNFKRDIRKGIDEDIEVKADELKKLQQQTENALAFEKYVKLNYGTDLVKKVTTVGAGRIKLDDMDGVNDEVKGWVKFLREEMRKFGEEEIKIGKLTQEQFDELADMYLYHLITPEGEKYLKEMNMIGEGTGAKLTDDLGFGTVFNQSAKSRTIRNLWIDGKFVKFPTIEQINEYFKPLLSGKNMFSENIADIYVARAMKHTELMYDDKYMKEMLDVFGKDFKLGDEVLDGYTPVMNHGMAKNMVEDLASLRTSMHISNAVTRYLTVAPVDEVTGKEGIPIIKQIANFVDAKMNFNPRHPGRSHHLLRKKLFNEEMEKVITKFLDENFDEVTMKELHEEIRNSISGSASLDIALNDAKIPMIELNSVKTSHIQSTYDGVIRSYENHIKDKVFKYWNNKMFEDGACLKDEDVATMQKYIDVMSVDDVVKYIDKLMSDADEFDAKCLNRILGNIEKLKSVSSPQIKQVNDAIVERANQARKIQIEEDTNDLLKIYDKFTHFIKLNQTAIMPAFHVRNKMSNMFNNWLAVGRDAVNVDFQKNAWKTVSKKGNVEELQDLPQLVITRPDGTKDAISWAELYKQAVYHNAVDEGFFAKDVGAHTATSGVIPKLSPKYDPTDTKNFVLYRLGTDVGSKIENSDRLVHFASMVRRGYSFEEASKSVTQTLFDYGDLTAFEQRVMKRIFPYYTWLRKNSELQIKNMIDNPEKYQLVAKILGGVEGMNNEEDRINTAFVNDFAVDWVQTPFTVTNPHGRIEPVLWNPNLPFMDLSRMPVPTEDGAKGTFVQTNPMLKLPVEFMMNRNMFFEQPIAEEGESIPLQYADHTASQLAPYNAGKDLIQKRGADWGLELLNNTAGIKALSYDYDAYKAQKIKELIEGEYDK